MARLQLKRRKESATDDLSGSLITVADPHGVASEDYRSLRTSLLYSLVDSPPKVVVVTSAGPSEGKSTTCANLGVVLAQADKQTLIVDCDMRKPTIHKILCLRNLQGLVNVLAGEHSLHKISQEALPGLKTITTGPIPPNPAELLSSRRFTELLNQAREEFDYVLLDAPPVGIVSDPAIAATQADGVLLVIDSQNTRKGSVRQAMRSLEGVGANVIGTVMNNIKASRRNGYYYHYNYAYGRESGV
jgi:capsular exopolysaccharide synthesis family protein